MKKIEKINYNLNNDGKMNSFKTKKEEEDEIKINDIVKKSEYDNVDFEIEEFKKILNMDFLNRIGKEFEYESKKNLFGLDFLFNKDSNTYCLIDCNYMPGYKELINDFSNILKQHILTYYKFHMEDKI